MRNLFSGMIPIWIPGEPPRATAQEKGETIVSYLDRRTGKVKRRIQHYDKPEVVQARLYYGYGVKRFRPAEPIKGPVSVKITWIFPTSNKRLYDKPKVTRPDVDNMAKALLDVMTGMYWKDDNQICELKLQKFWGSPEDAGTAIVVYYDLESVDVDRPECSSLILEDRSHDK